MAIQGILALDCVFSWFGFLILVSRCHKPRLGLLSLPVQFMPAWARPSVLGQLSVKPLVAVQGLWKAGVVHNTPESAVWNRDCILHQKLQLTTDITAYTRYCSLQQILQLVICWSLLSMSQGRQSILGPLLGLFGQEVFIFLLLIQLNQIQNRPHFFTLMKANVWPMYPAKHFIWTGRKAWTQEINSRVLGEGELEINQRCTDQQGCECLSNECFTSAHLVEPPWDGAGLSGARFHSSRFSDPLVIFMAHIHVMWGTWDTLNLRWNEKFLNSCLFVYH